MEGSLNWKQSEMLPFLNLMFLNPDICVKESCINAGDLFRCIDGVELKEFVMQWFAPAGEILMHPQCVTHTLGWLQFSQQQKWQREFFFSMKAH